ncbi:hypothetical protein CHS0354_015780 [Potamilus streckersoni]|uniref:Uncharacterized protein n=1 Tax=Potamilus streckersoni TaxID=2493646 RepID=A0AAE0T3G8_9BIVA|nr:hypothetical protein CHS0354_015780 [Potamilus streckersoni]
MFRCFDARKRTQDYQLRHQEKYTERSTTTSGKGLKTVDFDARKRTKTVDFDARKKTQDCRQELMMGIKQSGRFLSVLQVYFIQLQDSSNGIVRY